MRIAVPKETAPGERRVALVPESCKKLIQAGYEISVEAGAGQAAGFADAAYGELGVALEADPAALLGAGDLVLKVTAPNTGESGRDETGWMRPGTIYVGSLMPLRNREAVRALAARKVTAFSTDATPRTTGASDGHAVVHGQMGGYKAFRSPPPSSTGIFRCSTAAGMVFPAKVFVMAPALRLQAIATAPGLGANVVRPTSAR